MHHKLLSWEKGKGFWEKLVLPGTFENKVYPKFGGANRVYYGGFENRGYHENISKPEASQLVESLCDGGHSVAGKLE